MKLYTSDIIKELELINIQEESLNVSSNTEIDIDIITTIVTEEETNTKLIYSISNDDVIIESRLTLELSQEYDYEKLCQVCNRFNNDYIGCSIVCTPFSVTFKSVAFIIENVQSAMNMIRQGLMFGLTILCVELTNELSELGEELIINE